MNCKLRNRLISIALTIILVISNTYSVYSIEITNHQFNDTNYDESLKTVQAPNQESLDKPLGYGLMKTDSEITVNLESPTVEFADPWFKRDVAHALGKNPEDTITQADMELLEKLSTDCINLNGIQYAVNLKILIMDTLQSTPDFTPISSLKNLTEITVSPYDGGVGETNLFVLLPNFIKLKKLSLNDLSFKDEDFKYLSNLMDLEELSLTYQDLNTINFFPDLPNLKVLDFYGNNLNDDDIKVLRNKLPKLENLRLSNNHITDLSIISFFPNLKKLDATSTYFRTDIKHAENGVLKIKNPVIGVDGTPLEPIASEAYSEGEYLIWDNITDKYSKSLKYFYEDSIVSYSSDITIPITVNNCRPLITAKDLTLEFEEVFNPLDYAKASDYEDGNISSKIEVVTNTVDTSTPGEYDVFYRVLDSQGIEGTKKIKVTVLESNRKPVITGATNLTIEKGSSFDPYYGVEIQDFEDGDLSDNCIISGIVNVDKLGEYKLLYSITDSDGNTTIVERIITVSSNTVPELLGVEDITIIINEKFNPYKGVQANDAEDGDITNKLIITGRVNTSVVGEYILAYSITDSDGNTIKKSRKITVIKNYSKEDVNMDGVIDINDLTIAAQFHNSKSSHSNWKAEYDLNSDGIIDLYDYIMISIKL